MPNGHEPKEGEETQVFGSFVGQCWFSERETSGAHTYPTDRSHLSLNFL